MQVSDSTTLGVAPAGRKDEPAPNRRAEARRWARPRERFRATLEVGAGSEETAGLGGGANGPGRPSARAPSPAAAPVHEPARIDRLLLGEAAGAAEARIRIGAGNLAGAEIRLSVVGANAVTAQLLTPGAGSRETLSMVMEEIRRRLRARGISVVTQSARGGGAGRSRAGTGSGDGWPTRG